MEKDQITHLSRIKRRQVTLPLQNFAQRSVCRLIPTRAANNFGGDFLNRTSHTQSMTTDAPFGEYSTAKGKTELLQLPFD